MPLCIIVSTGPVLAFSTAIYSMSESLGVPYLTFNAWISVWLCGYCLLAEFLDLARYIKMAKRFTDEIFALLTVAIFVMDAVGDPFTGSGLLRYLDADHPSHNTEDPEYNYLPTALLSILIGFSTTALIFFFRGFKFSAYFCNDLTRTTIHDFAVILSVVIWNLVAELGFPEVSLEQLAVPASFEPTYQCCTSACDSVRPTDCSGQEAPFGSRPWFVDFSNMGGKAWVPFVAARPALGAFLLIYLDNGITWHLVNHKSHKSMHGEAVQL